LPFVLVGGDWLNSRYTHLPPRSPFLIGIYVGVFLVLVLAIVYGVKIVSRLSQWRKSWARCKHGVPGGLVRSLCKECTRERRLLDEIERQQRAFEERQQKIDTAAIQMRDKERLRLGGSIVPSLQELRRLTWQQFEDEMARMFGRFGYAVEQTPYVRDQGLDAILSKDGHKFLLECKKYGEGGLSGRPDLQKFHSAIITQRASHGLFVTTGAFTKDAVEFAATVGIELIDGSKLVRYMFDSKRAASEDDKYQSMCRKCGGTVYHRLRTPQVVNCTTGHPVEPTLTIESILATSGAAPNCQKCGAPMRVVIGNGKNFGGALSIPTVDSHGNGYGRINPLARVERQRGG
jgi:HJR/Mrr/RecB family endonuclease